MTNQLIGCTMQPRKYCRNYEKQRTKNSTIRPPMYSIPMLSAVDRIGLTMLRQLSIRPRRASVHRSVRPSDGVVLNSNNRSAWRQRLYITLHAQRTLLRPQLTIRRYWVQLRWTRSSIKFVTEKLVAALGIFISRPQPRETEARPVGSRGCPGKVSGDSWSSLETLFIAFDFKTIKMWKFRTIHLMQLLMWQLFLWGGRLSH